MQVEVTGHRSPCSCVQLRSLLPKESSDCKPGECRGYSPGLGNRNSGCELFTLRSDLAGAEMWLGSLSAEHGKRSKLARRPCVSNVRQKSSLPTRVNRADPAIRPKLNVKRVLSIFKQVENGAVLK